MRSAVATPADYSAFAGTYKGHETFHYPELGLEGRGQAVLTISNSDRGALLGFHRSLHVGGVNFPFAERTRFSPQRKFTSAISVRNFARFGNALGHARVTGNRIRFTASYPILGANMSLVEAATITVRERELVYKVIVEFATPEGLQRVAIFEFTGRRKS
jgi:hypothetical protein